MIKNKIFKFHTILIFSSFIVIVGTFTLYIAPNFLISNNQKAQAGSLPQIYYIDFTSGSDTNTGLSAELPWKTIAKINSSKFNPGDKILFKKGESWREHLSISSSGTSDSPISFGSYGNGRDPIFNGAEILTGWIDNSQEQFNTWKISLGTKPSSVWFNDEFGIISSGIEKLLSSRMWYWNENFLYVYSVSNPDTSYDQPGIEASYRSCLSVIRADYIILDGFSLTHCGILVAMSTGSIVRNNTISYGIGGIAVSTSPRTQIYGNNISNQYFVLNGADGGGIAYSVGDSPDSSTHDNEISYVDAYGIAVVSANTSGRIFRNNIDFSGQNRKADERVGVLIYGNNFDVYENTIKQEQPSSSADIFSFTGISSSGSNNNIYSNLVSNSSGIGLGISGNANTVSYNIIYGSNYSGIEITGGNGHSVYNNVFYNNGRSGGKNGNLYINNANGITVKNNIFGQYGGKYEVNIQSNSTVNDVDYNLYYHTTSGDFSWWKTSKSISFDDWKMKSGLDIHSKYSDPKFIDVSNGDFHLSPDSIAIDAGTMIPSLSRDFAGFPVPSGETTDIGAYEIISPDSSTPTPTPAPNPTPTPTPTPPPPPGGTNGLCATTLNSCKEGSFSDTEDTSTKYNWSCLGLNGGYTASCSLDRFLPPINNTPPNTNRPTNTSTYRPGQISTKINYQAPTINIPTTTVDISMPKLPSWLDFITAFILDIVSDIIRGVKRTGEMVGV